MKHILRSTLLAVVLALGLTALSPLALARPVHLSQDGCNLVAQMVTEAHIARQNDKPVLSPDSPDNAANAVTRFIIRHMDEFIPVETPAPSVFMAYIQGCYAANGMIDLPEEI